MSLTSTQLAEAQMLEESLETLRKQGKLIPGMEHLENWQILATVADYFNRMAEKIGTGQELNLNFEGLTFSQNLIVEFLQRLVAARPEGPSGCGGTRLSGVARWQV